MIPTRDDLLRKAGEAPAPPVAIEAFWDGDTAGWFVVLVVIYLDGSAQGRQHRDLDLAVMRGEGGDLRIFDGEVPPWPEAVRAKVAGEDLAARLGIPFFFASPEHPEDECPRWWEQSQSYPCRRCGIALLQRDRCPWRGACYHCHLAEKEEKREAQRSPEQRSAPRCGICGRPATEGAGTEPRCSDCLARYEDHECSGCGAKVTRLKGGDQASVCSSCELSARFAEVSESDRQAIRDAVAKEGEGPGIRAAMRILGWSLLDASFAVRRLTGRD